VGEPVALYTRVSSAAQVDNYSLPFQREQLLEYCRHRDLDPVDVYEDAGISGATLDDRPALQRLIRDAHQGKFRQVVIYRVDRFTRADPWDLFPLVKAMQDVGVRLVSASESFDLTDENGQLIFQILANFALRERNAIRTRTLGGKKAIAQAGQFTGGKIPFGYRVEAGRYVPDDTPWGPLTKADVVRRIFTQYAALDSIQSVLAWLEAEGIPPIETVWNRGTVAQILSHPVYKGEFAWGRRAYPMKGPSKRRTVDDWITRPDNHEPLVDTALWDDVARLREQRRRGGRHTLQERRLLDGFLVCGKCGASVGRRYQNQRVYYTCGSRFNEARRRAETACMDFPYFREEDLRAAIWTFFENLVMAGGPLEEAIAQRNAGDRPILAAAEQVYRDAQQRRETLRRQEARLLDFALRGIFSDDVLAEKQADLRSQQERADRDLRHAERAWTLAQEAARVGALDPRQVRVALQDFLRRDAAEAGRREILEQFLAQKIVVDPSGAVTVTLRLPVHEWANLPVALKPSSLP